MNRERFYLNPNAAAYIPLNRRGVSDDVGVNAQSENRRHTNGALTPYEVSLLSHDHPRGGTEPNGNALNPSNGSSASQNRNRMVRINIDLEEQYRMNIAYLSMTFPDISDETLAQVYEANNRDLEATLDLLDGLEEFENSPNTNNTLGSQPNANGHVRI